MTDSDVRRIEDKVDGLAIAFARLEGSLAPTLKDLTSGQEDLTKLVDDHEIRLRAAERFRFAFPSIAVIALMADIAIGIFLVLHT